MHERQTTRTVPFIRDKDEVCTPVVREVPGSLGEVLVGASKLLDRLQQRLVGMLDVEVEAKGLQEKPLVAQDDLSLMLVNSLFIMQRFKRFCTTKFSCKLVLGRIDDDRIGRIHDVVIDNRTRLSRNTKSG